MTRKLYNKLIRDHIPAIIDGTGQGYATTSMTEEEFEAALRAKLVEEATEIQKASSTEMLTELADLMEVVDTLLDVHGFSWEQVKLHQTLRRQSRGGFIKRLKLLWTE